MKTRSYVMIAISVIILVGSFIAWRIYTKGPRDVIAAYGIPVNSKDLYRQFSQDSIKANIKFEGKVVKVKGILKKISENNQQMQVLLLESGMEGANVNCTMEEKAICKEGDLITIKGICSGMGTGDVDLGIKGDVYIIRAYFIK